MGRIEGRRASSWPWRLERSRIGRGHVCRAIGEAEEVRVGEKLRRTGSVRESDVERLSNPEHRQRRRGDLCLHAVDDHVEVKVESSMNEPEDGGHLVQCVLSDPSALPLRRG